MSAFYSSKRADNFRLAKSKFIVAPSNGILEVLRIPRFAFVEVFIEKRVVSSAGTVTVGVQGDKKSASADFFFSSAEAAGDTLGLLASPDLKYFADASGAITVTTASNFNGSIYIFARYSVIH